jgi:diguanylate cyclase (GGDEF)-like protein/PAS domain S-box-containing protein/putative nucleotidyltransferase with HDIG domain
LSETRRWLDRFSRAERAELLAWVWNTQDEGAVLVDADRRVLDANDAACALLGRGRDELLDSVLPDPPVDAPEIRVRTHRRDDEPLGTVALVTLTDVAAEVRARRAIERIAESVEELLFITRVGDAGAMRIVYLGPGVERLLGGRVPPGQDVVDAWLEAIHPDDRAAVQDAVAATARGEPSGLEYRVVGYDGQVRWVRSRTQRRQEADGVYVDGMVSDVTAVRAGEREMARFRAAVEASGSAIALLDPDWRVRWMNPAGLAMTGLDATSAAGLPYADLVGDEARAEHLEVERPTVEREGRWSGESVLRPVDRARRPLPVDATTYRIEHPATGEHLGLACIRRDITVLHRLAREHEAIGDLARTIAAGTGREEIHEAACREAAHLLGADAGGIAMAGTGAAGPRTVGTWRGPGADDRLQLAIGRLAALAHDGGGPCRVDLGDGHHAIGAPVAVEGRPWGLIAASRRGAPFTAEDERALGRLGGLVGTAVEVATSRELLVRQATTDGLTGLCNHRAFHDHLRAEAARAARYDRPLAVVLADLDGFKEVNDRHGHQTGDRLLVAVARALEGVVRGTEVVARLGGDEFAVLLPETDVIGAEATAERLRAAVAALPEAAAHGVTASAGVADLGQAQTADELIRLADGALYWSKVHGRDRVSAYDPERVEALSATERAERLARGHALGAVRVLARLIDLKDASTHRHSERVAELAVRLAHELGWPEERCALLRDAALVHDVGKVVIDDALLRKPGALTPDEYEVVKEHAPTGAQIAAEALNAEQTAWIAQHHERPDGAGYPAGLSGAEISEGGLILAFADVWDVMTSARPYKEAKGVEEALGECRALAGRQFDGAVVAAFERLLDRGAVPEPPA